MHLLSVIGVFLYWMLITMLVIRIVMDNRQPAKTMAWGMVMFFVPVIGLVLYFFFGMNTRKERLISQRSLDLLSKRSMLGFVKQDRLQLPQPYRPVIDLFVNQNATRSNTTVVLREGAAVVSDARSSFGQWRQERLHRTSSHRFYGLGNKLSLLVYPLSQCVFLAALLWLWIGGLFPWQLLAAVLAVKIIWQIVCCALLAKRFSVKKIQFFSPFFELYFLFANTFLFFSTLRKKNIQWR